jgi:hypothetical protein
MNMLLRFFSYALLLAAAANADIVTNLIPPTLFGGCGPVPDNDCQWEASAIDAQGLVAGTMLGTAFNSLGVYWDVGAGIEGSVQAIVVFDHWDDIGNTFGPPSDGQGVGVYGSANDGYLLLQHGPTTPGCTYNSSYTLVPLGIAAPFDPNACTYNGQELLTAADLSLFESLEAGDQGQQYIVNYPFDGGVGGAYVVTPGAVPEPSSLYLFGTATILTIGLKRRFSKRF